MSGKDTSKPLSPCLIKWLPKPLSPCPIKWLPTESTGPESSNWQLAYTQHTSTAVHSAIGKAWKRGLQGSDKGSENKNLAEMCPRAPFSHHNANLNLPRLSVPTQPLPVAVLIFPRFASWEGGWGVFYDIYHAVSPLTHSAHFHAYPQIPASTHLVGVWLW